MKDVYGIILLATAVVAGCGQSSTPPGEATPAKAKAPVARAEPAPENRGVAKIVFVGQKDACECTRKRVDDSLAALEKALSGRTDIPVEKLELDVDKAEVAVYQELGAIMVAPAIYLLDGSGGLVEMLQGAVTPDQILVAMGG
jgi:hypothetical protein